MIKQKYFTWKGKPLNPNGNYRNKKHCWEYRERNKK